LVEAIVRFLNTASLYESSAFDWLKQWKFNSSPEITKYGTLAPFLFLKMAINNITE